jgi:hypothetical protein
MILVAGAACSNDFLEKNNQDLYTLNDTLYLNSSQESIETSVEMPGVVNADFSIFMQPKWLLFKSMHGEIVNGNVPLSVRLVDGFFPVGYQVYYGAIILNVENIGLVSFTVACANYGSPVLECSISSLAFESPGSRVFTIKNTVDGILKWKMAGVPDWLIFSPSDGSISNGSSVVVTASLNFNNISLQQDLTGSVQIQSNSVTGNLTIPVHVLAAATVPPETIQISGVVTDAEFSIEPGIIVISTKFPNSLIIFNSLTDQVNSVPLDKTPGCISVSDDGKKVVIGYTVSSVGYFDIENLQMIQEFPVDCVPFDIVYGNNGWSYISPTVDQWVNFRNLNLGSGELFQNSGFMIYEKTLLKKIPGKPFLVGTGTMVSPSGILIFDITKGKASDTTTYFHTPLEKFWISRDGKKLYDNFRHIYNLPDFDGQYHIPSPPLYGQLESDATGIVTLEDCPAVNSIFVAFSFNWAVNSSAISQYNATNLNQIRTLSVSPVYITENGNEKLYDTSPRFIFVNKEGSKIFAIKNLKEQYSQDYWTMEILGL